MTDLIQQHQTSFDKLYKLYSDYNAHTNLSSIRTKDEVYKKHFEDSLSIIPYMNGIKSLIDIGTGGGFPALPLAIVLPQIKITAIDSVGKKIKFLELVKSELGLTNLEPIACRAEELAQDKAYREKYDIAVSRAVAELRLLLEYSIPFIKPKGQFIAYKKAELAEELKLAQNAIKTLKLELKSQVKSDDKQLLIFEKKSSTPSIYPRANKDIQKKPL